MSEKRGEEGLMFPFVIPDMSPFVIRQKIKALPSKHSTVEISRHAILINLASRAYSIYAAGGQ
jgi:hypothetical protein